jgi:hypothetical protein
MSTTKAIAGSAGAGAALHDGSGSTKKMQLLVDPCISGSAAMMNTVKLISSKSEIGISKSIP